MAEWARQPLARDHGDCFELAEALFNTLAALETTPSTSSSASLAVTAPSVASAAEGGNFYGGGACACSFGNVASGASGSAPHISSGDLAVILGTMGDLMDGSCCCVPLDAALVGANGESIGREDFLQAMCEALGVVGRRAFNATMRHQLMSIAVAAGASGAAASTSIAAAGQAAAGDAGEAEWIPLREAATAAAVVRRGDSREPSTLLRRRGTKAKALPAKSVSTEDGTGTTSLKVLASGQQLQRGVQADLSEDMPFSPTNLNPRLPSKTSMSGSRISKRQAIDQFSELGRDAQNVQDPDAWLGELQIAPPASWHSPEETLIFFDWDDTLCPTEFIRGDRRLSFDQTAPCFEDGPAGYHPYMTLGAKGGAAPGKEVLMAAALRRHVEVASAALRTASALGRVVIVTLARQDWVDRSAKHFMPGIKDVINELGIKVVYARYALTKVEHRQAQIDELDILFEMKSKAMATEARRFYRKRSWSNILCIGDSYTEIDSIIEVTFSTANIDASGLYKECRCKTMKLVEGPTLLQLTAQLEALVMIFRPLVGYDGDADIDLMAGQESHLRLVRLLNGWSRQCTQEHEEDGYAVDEEEAEENRPFSRTGTLFLSKLEDFDQKSFEVEAQGPRPLSLRPMRHCRYSDDDFSPMSSPMTSPKGNHQSTELRFFG